MKDGQHPMHSRARTTTLTVALMFSLLAHAVAITGGWITLPHSTPDPAPLTAHLTPAPAPAAAPASPAPVAKPAPRPRPAAVAAAPMSVPSDAPLLTLPTPEPMAGETPATEALAQPEPAAPEPEPVMVANAAPSTFAPEPSQIKNLPKRGRIAYDMTYNLNEVPLLVGHTVQSWQTADDNYQLESRSEPLGVARFTRFGPRTYRSSGAVTGRGLQPQRFSAHVMLRGKADESAAQFDWDKNTLQFGRSDDRKNSVLPEGSQDLLSFMFQLSLAPPPRGRLQLPVTTGTRFETYDMEVLAEEIIETPMGNLRALPIKQLRRPGRESIEVWLAADYHYLPVRIRVIARDGSPGGEQVATAIQIGDQ